MLVTLAEVKAFISKLNSDAYTTAINLYIPIIENKIASICNNHFVNPPVKSYVGSLYITSSYGYTASDGFVFAAAGRTITRADADFLEAGFAAVDDIFIEGTYRNNGHFALQAAAETVLTVNSLYTIRDESQNTVQKIYVVYWPIELKPIAAQMIAHKILHINDDTGMKSESIGDYSYTRDEVQGEFPQGILKDLARYKVPVFA